MEKPDISQMINGMLELAGFLPHFSGHLFIYLRTTMIFVLEKKASKYYLVNILAKCCCWNIQMRLLQVKQRWADSKHKAEVYLSTTLSLNLPKMHTWSSFFKFPLACRSYFVRSILDFSRNSIISPFFEHFLAKILTGLDGGRHHGHEMKQNRQFSNFWRPNRGQKGTESDFGSYFLQLGHLFSFFDGHFWTILFAVVCQAIIIFF